MPPPPPPHSEKNQCVLHRCWAVEKVCFKKQNKTKQNKTKNKKTNNNNNNNKPQQQKTQIHSAKICIRFFFLFFFLKPCICCVLNMLLMTGQVSCQRERKHLNKSLICSEFGVEQLFSAINTYTEHISLISAGNLQRNERKMMDILHCCDLTPRG